MEQGQKQSHPFLIKNGKSQGSPNTRGFDGTNIKAAHNTAVVCCLCDGGEEIFLVVVLIKPEF